MKTTLSDGQRSIQVEVAEAVVRRPGLLAENFHRETVDVDRAPAFCSVLGLQVLVEDRTTTPAQTAAARIDIAAWLLTLPKKKRRIAALLATGETTKRTAMKFHVSLGRFSQMRRELQKDWQAFQGDDVLE